MHPKRIYCDVSFSTSSTNGFHGYSEAFDQDKSIEDYLSYFAEKIRESNHNVTSITIERIWLTKHDSEGNYLVSKNGVVEKDVIWQNQ